MDYYGIIRQQDTQSWFYNIHALIISGMWTNKEEPVKVNGYGAIDIYDKAENNFYIVCFTSVPHILQEVVE